MIEQDAHDFYVQVSHDRNVKDENLKNCFSRIAEDELHHIELVQRIINIVRTAYHAVQEKADRSGDLSLRYWRGI